MECVRLERAILRGANLIHAQLPGAHLQGANLQGANLQETRFYNADLRGANLRDTNLYGTNFETANLEGCDLREARLNYTLFGDRDFRTIRGLQSVIGVEPSPLSIRSIFLSQGQLPDAFILACGIDALFLKYLEKMRNDPNIDKEND